MAKFLFRGIFLWVVLFFGLNNICGAQEEKRRSAYYYYRTGEVQLEKQNWTKANELFNACLNENPYYYDAYYSRAIVYEHFDSLNKALTDFNIYLEFRPDHKEALFGRAQARLRLEQFALAKEDYLKLLKMPSAETTSIFFRQDASTGQVDKMFTANGGKDHLYNAIGLIDTRLLLYNEAVLYFDSALRSAPNDPDILVNRGLAKVGKLDTAGAVVDYQRALKSNPDHFQAKENLRTLARGKNVVVNEARLLDEAIEENPQLPLGYAERAFMNFEKGNYEIALKDYDKAIALDSSEPSYFLNRGLIKEMMKDENGAYEDYTRAISIQNNFGKAWLNRGNLLTKQGKLTEAVEDYSMAIKCWPEFASAFYNRAVTRNRLKQKELACEDLHTAERLGLPIENKARKSICGN